LSDNGDTVGVEVTPEMIEAGVDALVTFNERFESPEEAVERIHRAMFCASPFARPHEPCPVDPQTQTLAGRR
jgi:hypothetical protein